MKTLFIDTHSELLTFILEIDDKIYKKEELSKRDMSVVALPTLDDLFKMASIEPHEIDLIIVVNGPGSFTGVRIGVTVAKCIAYSFDIPIKTITSLEAYGSSTKEKFDVVIVPDPKGFYSARMCDGKFVDVMYQSKQKFEEYIKENSYKVLDSFNLDIMLIKRYLENTSSVNPHMVNPVYIKEIDALK